jgi:hypothetical protein
VVSSWFNRFDAKSLKSFAGLAFTVDCIFIIVQSNGLQSSQGFPFGACIFPALSVFDSS